MPDRMLRTSVLTSNSIDMLSDAGESMFNRLLLNCDDFGRFEADHRVLLARCYPLKVGTMTTAEIADRIQELISAGIIQTYTVGDKCYGVFSNWAKHNRMRAKASKFPEPPTSDNTCQQTTTEDGVCVHSADIREHLTTYTESESESESESDIPQPPSKGARLTDAMRSEFKAAYPRRLLDQNWPQAWKRLEAHIKGGADWAAIMAGVKRYAALIEANGKAGTEFVKQAATWVNQQGWKDEFEPPSLVTNGQSKRVLTAEEEANIHR